MPKIKKSCQASNLWKALSKVDGLPAAGSSFTGLLQTRNQILFPSKASAWNSWDGYKVIIKLDQLPTVFRLKKFAYKNKSTCVCVVCVSLSVALSLRDHSWSLKKQLAEDLLNSRLGFFFFFFFDRRERPTWLRRSSRNFPSLYTKYIKTNIFSNCDSCLIHFQIKAKRIVS